jgi:hypothetical protein
LKKVHPSSWHRRPGCTFRYFLKRGIDRLAIYEIVMVDGRLMGCREGDEIMKNREKSSQNS